MNRSVVSPGRLALAAVALTLWSSGAFAQALFFGSDDPRGGMVNSTAARNAFVSSLTSFGVDNIESHPSFSTSPTLVFGGTGVMASTPAGMLVVDFTGQPFNYAVSGVKMLLDFGPQTPDGGNFADTFTLSQVVHGFGMYVAQAGDLANVNTISVVLENTNTGSSQTIPLGTFGPGRSDDNIFFFGVISNVEFNRVTINESFDFDGTLYDDVTVGYAAVPEPGSIALIGAAVAGVGFRWYRRRFRQR